MSIKKFGFAKHEPQPPPHARLTLSIIECAVSDIKTDDAPRQRSAARFSNGSREFYFWAHVLEQDSKWLLRGLRARCVKTRHTRLSGSHETLALSTLWLKSLYRWS